MPKSRPLVLIPADSIEDLIQDLGARQPGPEGTPIPQAQTVVEMKKYLADNEISGNFVAARLVEELQPRIKKSVTFGKSDRDSEE